MSAKDTWALLAEYGITKEDVDNNDFEVPDALKKELNRRHEKWQKEEDRKKKKKEKEVAIKMGIVEEDIHKALVIGYYRENGMESDVIAASIGWKMYEDKVEFMESGFKVMDIIVNPHNTVWQIW